MDQFPYDLAAKIVHSHLRHLYLTHAEEIEKKWNSYSEIERGKCFELSCPNAVLKHRSDEHMGFVYKAVPELNKHDFTKGGPEYFLRQLKHRATTSLYQQYCDGPSGGPGDYKLVTEAAWTIFLRRHEQYRNRYTLFLNDEEYGEVVEAPDGDTEKLAGLIEPLKTGNCVTQHIGDIILCRQATITDSLMRMALSIVNKALTKKARKKLPRNPDAGTSAAQPDPCLESPPPKLSLTELRLVASEHSAIMSERLSLLLVEPRILAHEYYIWFLSEPARVPDEKGRRLPSHSESDIIASMFEAIRNATKDAAIWSCISHLLELLQINYDDKAYRIVILQELANVFHSEYGRMQMIFRRHIQSGTGSKRFYRLSGTHNKDGSIRILMRGNPEELTRKDPQLHYILRLCQTQTNVTEAAKWLEKLDLLYKNYPTERDSLEEREVDSLCILGFVAGFFQELSLVAPIPSFSRKSGQIFLSKLQVIETTLGRFKASIDLASLEDSAVGYNSELGVMKNYLSRLDQFMKEETGVGLETDYQDLISQCLTEIQDQSKSKSSSKHSQEVHAPLPAAETSELPERRSKERKTKEKTRPLPSPNHDIALTFEGTKENETLSLPCIDNPEEDNETLSGPQTFEVRFATALVFSKLFEKSEHRGPIRWVDFLAAMKDVGFSCFPKYGSVYTFNPPAEMGLCKRFTAHRPHQSRIEGLKKFVFVGRLKRLYGWNEHTFKVAPTPDANNQSKGSVDEASSGNHRSVLVAKQA